MDWRAWAGQVKERAEVLVEMTENSAEKLQARLIVEGATKLMHLYDAAEAERAALVAAQAAQDAEGKQTGAAKRPWWRMR